MKNQYEVQQQFLAKFLDFILVKCPNCELCARVTKAANSQESSAYASHICTCPHCSYTNATVSHDKIEIQSNEAIDPFFRLPLYLTAQCQNHVLWAYNLEHLQYIESYIEVKQKNDCFVPPTFDLYLPDWITDKRVQEEALTEIQRLKSSVFYPIE
ncbi:hypothetical protein FZC66_07455 [Priestia megaterium]|nr:hypothetical protein FZC66_07455 [Priestia megaterium]